MTELIYVCVVCGHLLDAEHQVCCEACYALLVKLWAEAMTP